MRNATKIIDRGANKKVISILTREKKFSPDRATTHFVIDEVSCVSYVGYQIWVKATVVLLALFATVSVGYFSNWMFGLLALISSVFFVVKFFRDYGEITTTGGQSYLVGNWFTLAKIVNEIDDMGEHENTKLVVNSSTMRGVFLINPYRLASLRIETTSEHYPYFLSAGLLPLTYFFQPDYLVPILLMSAALMIIGFLIWKNVVSLDMIGGFNVEVAVMRMKAQKTVDKILDDIEYEDTSNTSDEKYPILKLDQMVARNDPPISGRSKMEFE